MTGREATQYSVWYRTRDRLADVATGEVTDDWLDWTDWAPLAEVHDDPGQALAARDALIPKVVKVFYRRTATGADFSNPITLVELETRLRTRTVTLGEWVDLDLGDEVS